MTSHHAPARARHDAEHDVRSAVAVVLAGAVLLALLIGGTALVTTVLDVARWVGGA